MTQQLYSWSFIPEMKIYGYTKTCSQIFTATLSIIAKNKTQPRCPSMGEWLNKPWYIHTME